MNDLPKILIIGSVWPEPNSSAAGSRMMYLIGTFLKQHWKVTFVSTAAESPFMSDLESLGVDKYQILLNSSTFDDFVKDLRPDIVMFDRFMVEEQFGWRVAEACPQALRILDTEDLHTLRYARQAAFKQQRSFKQEDLLDTEMAFREIASIYRCDMTLVISAYEMKILKDVFKIDDSLLFYLPFQIERSDEIQLPDFNERAGFISIGNFLHEPNWNAVLYLKEQIWPAIRKRLPKAILKVYGAYPSQKVLALDNKKEGFYIEGRADSVADVMSVSRVCLAPLRFGAGLKGKLIDAMFYGTPNVTTAIGAEAMDLGLPWAGFIEDDASLFAEKAVELYTDQILWQQSVENGYRILEQNFSIKLTANFVKAVIFLLNDLEHHRKHNFMGRMLMHHAFASTKFMSKWIEEKHSGKTP